MKQTPLPADPPTAAQAWSWPRLLHQLGVGPSAVSMLAWPYLHRLGRTPAPPPRHPAGRS